VEVGTAGREAGRSIAGEPYWSLAEADSKLSRKLVFDYFSPRNRRRMRRAIEEFSADIVHVHNIYGISSQVIHEASVLRPTVVTLHDYWPIDVFVPRVRGGQLRYPMRHTIARPWVWLHRRMHKAHLAQALLVSPSTYLQQRMQQAGYQGVRVIPNGISPPERTTSREKTLLFVGRLAPEKGLQLMLGTAAAVAGEEGWSVAVVGDGPLLNELRAAHQDVVFHGRADPAVHYARAGAVFVPSLWPENLPYVVLEAMSYGVPVIASSVGGIPELVEHERTGLLYEAEDKEAFASALMTVMRDARMAQDLGEAGRGRVASEFHRDRVGGRFLALYEEQVARTPRLPGERGTIQRQAV
jgi:glycosyltransferase involved in cell wall biosynthesis